VLLLQQEISQAHNRRAVGAVLPVLIDTRDRDGRARGRRRIDAPDVDGTVHIAPHPACVPGAILPVRITRAGPYDLHGSCVIKESA